MQQRLSTRPRVTWLTADQLAGRLDRSLRHTNQRLTDAGRDWGATQPLCRRGERHQQILWDPAVVALRHQAN